MAKFKSLFLNGIIGFSALMAVRVSAQPQQTISNFELLALRLAETHRDISHWEQELAGLRRSLRIEREAASGGRVIAFVTVSPALEAYLEAGRAIGAASGIAGLAAAGFVQMSSKARVSLMMASVVAIFLGVESYQLKSHGKGLIFRLNSQDAKRLVTAMGQAQKEIELLQERLGVLEKELARDARFQEAKFKILSLVDEQLSSEMSLEDLGRNENYIEDIRAYLRLPQDFFKHSTKEDLALPQEFLNSLEE